MLDRQDDEQLADMLAVAEEAGEVEAGEVTVDAMDLVRVLQEVIDRRADDHASDTHDELIEWAHTEAGGRALWKAWHDAMQSQHRDVGRHRAKWEILEPQDQLLDGRIAVLFVTAMLDAVHNGKEVTGGS